MVTYRIEITVILHASRHRITYLAMNACMGPACNSDTCTGCYNKTKVQNDYTAKDQHTKSPAVQ